MRPRLFRVIGNLIALSAAVAVATAVSLAVTPTGAPRQLVEGGIGDAVSGMVPIETLVYKWAVQYALSTVLSSQSGVRAFTPAFLLSLMAMVNPDVIELDSSMQWLRHPATAAVFGVLAVLEIVAEFVPAVDHVLHQIMTFVHPVTGILIAIAPKLGDETVTGFVQAPMAIFGGTWSRSSSTSSSSCCASPVAAASRRSSPPSRLSSSC